MNARQIKALAWVGALGLGGWLGWTIYEFVEERQVLQQGVSEEAQVAVLNDGLEARVDEEIRSVARVIVGVRYNPKQLSDFDFAFTLSFCYHLCNGVRHLFWDAGKGFELTTVYATGRAAVALSVVMTVAAWAIALS